MSGPSLLPEWATEENLAIARQMRGGENDHSYADIAEHFGLPRGQWKVVKDALDKAPTPPAVPPLAEMAAQDAPKPAPVHAGGGLAKLQALAQKAQTMEKSEEADSMRAEVLRSRKDRKPSEAEVDLLEQVFVNAWPDISYEEMGAAMDPPRHWLTVTRALGERGWVSPTHKILPYCTSTPEGQAQLMREQRAGLIDPATWAREYVVPGAEGGLGV